MNDFHSNWQIEFQRLKNRSKDRFTKPPYTVEDLFHTLNCEWQEGLQKIDELFIQFAVPSIWERRIAIWELCIELLAECVNTYELSREKVQFADRFGMYYRTVSMVEAEQLIHSNRWISQFSEFAAIEESIPVELDDRIEKLLLRLNEIWKSAVPEQIWISAWILEQFKHWKPLKKFIQSQARFPGHEWMKEWLLGHDVQCKKLLNQLSPILRIRAICLILYIGMQYETEHVRSRNWLIFSLDSIQYASPQEADVIWRYWEMYIEKSAADEATTHFVDGLLNHLPNSKERLRAFFSKHQQWDRIIEIEMLTAGEPRNWTNEEWLLWVQQRPELLIPWLHQRIDIVRKYRPQEREAELPFLLQSLQHIYDKMNQSEVWENYWAWFLEQHGRIREIKTMFDKEVSR